MVLIVLHEELYKRQNSKLANPNSGEFQIFWKLTKKGDTALPNN